MKAVPFLFKCNPLAYLALLRSPSDRKQIEIIGERMFDKNRIHFLNAYLQRDRKTVRIPVGR